MRHENVLNVMRRAIRKEICPTCFRREPFVDGTNSTEARPTEARQCEAGCSIFINLPMLKRLSQKSIHDSTISLEDEILEKICARCESNETAGDYCRDRTSRSCPLSRYGFDVIEVLERVVGTYANHSR